MAIQKVVLHHVLGKGCVIQICPNLECKASAEDTYVELIEGKYIGVCDKCGQEIIFPDPKKVLKLLGKSKYSLVK